MAYSLDLFAKNFLNKNKQKQKSDSQNMPSRQFDKIDKIATFWAINNILGKGIDNQSLKDCPSRGQNINNDIRQYSARISFQLKDEIYEMNFKIEKK